MYGREHLGPRWGFIAGWGFVVGKTASCAAMASTIGAYVAPDHSRLLGILAIVGVTAVNIGGLQRTVGVTRILLTVTAAVLLLSIVSGLSSNFDPSLAVPWSTDSASTSVVRSTYDVFQSAGLLFFAFAGYARIATLGEEVRDPARTIPRAIALALSGVLLLYGLICFTLLGSLTSSALASTPDPLRLVVESGPFGSLAPLVSAGATIAALGALLNLLPGVSRTALAMARHHDLPTFFSHVDTRRSLPVRAEIAIACAASLIVLMFELRSSIALSGVGVLSYYAITNASALTLESRRRQKVTAAIGLVSCLALLVTLPVGIVVTGSIVLLIGVIARETSGRLRRTPSVGSSS